MKKWISAILTVAVLVYVALGSLSCALTASLNHDEHQFMASAAMVAREGMQPYRDFAYLQMPNLVYVYALFYFTGHPFLAARLFNGACGFGLCLIIFLAARSVFRSIGPLSATMVAAAFTVLLPSTASFELACSKVWNHSSANLCAVLAFFAHSKAMRENKRVYFLWSGLALGMALGIRLTFAPLLAPFLLAAVIVRASSWTEKIKNVGTFVAGALIANLPAIYFCLTSYRDFMFGTFSYRELDPRYLRSLPGTTAAMSFHDKLYSSFNWLRHDYGAAAIAMLTGVALIFLIDAWIARKTKPRLEVIFLASLFPFLLIGFLLPTPSQFTYSFMFVPSLLLLGIYAISSGKIDNRILALVAVAVVAASSFFDVSRIEVGLAKSTRALRPAHWVPLEIEKTARWIRAQVSPDAHGKVLTLSPIFAIEAGLPIYREFVTGPFAWRVSHEVAPEEAVARKIPWSPGIQEFLENDPPAAVITGLELRPDLEAPIINAIVSLGYEPRDAPNCGVLWVRPAHQ